jgi:thiol-disulfide isomerase/thioredoxin
MERIIPRKYNNPVTIGLGCLVIVAIILIIYFLMNRDTPPKQPQPQQQRPQQQRQQPQPNPPFETRVNNDQDKPTLVLFWAKWCGHSKSMQGDWDRASQILNESGAISAIAFEHGEDTGVITEAQKKLSNFKGFPDIRFFPDGFSLDKRSIQFSGAERTEENLLKFAYKGGVL